MNAQSPIDFPLAQRTGTHVFLALAGTTGTGKTLCALRIARALCDGDDSRIFGIDTEGGRMLHYAPGPGEAKGPFIFGFRHYDMPAPYSPQAFLAAIKAAQEAGAKAIVIDSWSDEYEGDGGLESIHQTELERMATYDGKINYARMEALSGPAWKKPKTLHREVMARLRNMKANIIFCLRARDKVKFDKVRDERTGRDKTVIIPIGWQPICEKGFMYEVTASLLLSPDQPGVPKPIKLSERHRSWFPEGHQIDEACGRRLAAWATGAASASQAGEKINSPIRQQGASSTGNPPADPTSDPGPAGQPSDQGGLPLDPPAGQQQPKQTPEEFAGLMKSQIVSFMGTDTLDAWWLRPVTKKQIQALRDRGHAELADDIVKAYEAHRLSLQEAPPL